MRLATTCAAVASGIVFSACTALSPSRPLAQAPQLLDAETRCRRAAENANPLVTEWSAPERAHLEALLGQGAIAVAYSGCSMRLLPGCRLRGRYVWQQTTLARDTIEINNADDLFAKLPLGALSLEGQLRQQGRLAVKTTVVGQHQLADFQPESIPSDGSCLGATHILSAISVGAFKIDAGGAATVAAGVTVAGIGSGQGQSQSSELTLREAGIVERCEQTTAGAPQRDCAAPIQAFLSPLPQSIADRGPPGSIKVRFLPPRPDEPWQVMVADRTVCETPCERWIDPAMPFSLKHDPGFWHRNEVIDIPDMRNRVPGERLLLSAEPRNSTKLVLGILSTTFGGLGLATGITLTAAGCGSDHAGICKAGLFTMPTGLLIIPGVYWIIDSAPRVELRPLPAPTLNSYAPMSDGSAPPGTWSSH